jgi:hypothetical protein
MSSEAEAAVEAALAARGGAETRWLWGRFKASGRALGALSEATVSAARRRHIGALLLWPAASGAASLAAAAALERRLAAHFSVFPGAALVDRLMPVLLAGLCVYAAWFTAAVVQRTWLHPWGRIASGDLAFMLSRGGWRAWLAGTLRAQAVRERLAAFAVNGRWDDPAWAMRLKAEGGEYRPVEALAPLEAARRMVREVLGHKDGPNFVPGRYLDNLKERKASVTRFVKGNQEALTALREDRLPVPGALALLEALAAELKEGSAGARAVAGVLGELTGRGALPSGVVEAKVWAREPLEDLGSAADFFSSASLRTGSWKDAFVRRTKGALGPFGYLRNPAVSAMDFRTKDGRGVRARLGAVLVRGHGRDPEAALFVDAVEGRFDVRPSAVRAALEAYARDCGFKAVLYHAFPLNAVPRRFVAAVEASGAPLRALDVAYVDASEREYLDAWGLPFEPFEYAFPHGRVYAFVAAAGEATGELGTVPSRAAVLARGARARGLLWGMAAASVAAAGWAAMRAV